MTSISLSRWYPVLQRKRNTDREVPYCSGTLSAAFFSYRKIFEREAHPGMNISYANAQMDSLESHGGGVRLTVFCKE